MRHDAEDVPLRIDDPRDVFKLAVRIGLRRDQAVGLAVPKHNPAFRVQGSQRLGVGIIISFGMSNRHPQYLAFRQPFRERCVSIFDAHMHIPADEREGPVSQHDSGQKTCLQENLKAVANAKNKSPAMREAHHGGHDRGKSRDGACAEVVPIGKTSGNHDGVQRRKAFRLVPDELRGSAESLRHHMMAVLVAVRAGKNDDADAFLRLVHDAVLLKQVKPEVLNNWIGK
jgi:hypothetical protein